MSDEKITALIESIIDDHAELHIYQDEGYVSNSDVLAGKIVAALEASAQAPAVSREALARHFYIQDNAYNHNVAGRWAGLMERVKAGREPAHGDWSCFRKADALIASGILQDAAEQWRKAFYAGERRMMENQAFASPEEVEAERAAAIREGRA